MKLIKIKLTEKQADIADWLLGCPTMSEWFEPFGTESYFSHLSEPKLEETTLFMPANKDVIECAVEELLRYQDMARDEFSGYYPDERGKLAGEIRASNNLIQKLEKVIG